MQPLLAASAWGGLTLYVAIVTAVAAVALAGPTVAPALGVLGVVAVAVSILGGGVARRFRLRWTAVFALGAAGLGLWRAAAVTQGAVQPWIDAPRRPVGA